MKQPSALLIIGIATVLLGGPLGAYSGEQTSGTSKGMGDKSVAGAGSELASVEPGTPAASAGLPKAKELMDQADSLFEAAIGKVRAAILLDPELEGAERLLRQVREGVDDLLWMAADAATNKVPVIELSALPPGEPKAQFEDAVRKIARQHGFTDPQFSQTLEKTGTVWRAVFDRPRLNAPGRGPESSPKDESLGGSVEVTPDGRVTLRLVPFCRVASNYALLGRMFQVRLGITRERAEMARELRAVLDR
jgi:hypothetical protein